MKNFLLASVVIAGGACGWVVPVAAAEQTVTIAPALRAGDVARCNVLTTMSMDMPETDDPTLARLMADSLIAANQEVTWTVQRVEPGYSVIAQEFTPAQVANSDSMSMMSRISKLRYEFMTGPLECRIGANGVVDDVLNGGEVAAQMIELLERAKPILDDFANDITKAANDAGASDAMKKTMAQAWSPSTISQQMVNTLIGKPLFSGSWLWGQTLTVGKPVASAVPASELSADIGAMGQHVTGTRTVTLQAVSEHDISVTWVTDATMTMQMPEQPKVDTSKWPEASRKQYEKSMADMERIKQPSTIVENGTLRLDRRTGMPIAGTIVMQMDGGAGQTQMVTVYSPSTSLKTGK